MSQLTLKCERFGLSRGLQDMLTSGDLVDVTLACQGQFIQAHKTVLAACSPHFRAIFKLQAWQQPIVFMHDVELTLLQALVDFMYNGEVTVEDTDLPGFLKLADALNVSGLTTQNKEIETRLPRDVELRKMSVTHTAPSTSTPPPAKIARRNVDSDVSTPAPPNNLEPEPQTWQHCTEQVELLTSHIKLETQEQDSITLPVLELVSGQDCETEEEKEDSYLDVESTHEDDCWHEAGPSTSNSSQPSTSSTPASQAVSSRGVALTSPVDEITLSDSEDDSCDQRKDVQRARTEPEARRTLQPTAKYLQSKQDNCIESYVNFCELCNSNFKSEKLLQDHLNTKRHKMRENVQSRPTTDPLLTSPRSYLECVHCPSKFIYKDSLSRHLELVHLDVKSYFCDECNMKFPSQLKLSQHNVNQHYNPLHVYRCNLCKLGFKRKTDLKEHLGRIHDLSSKYGHRTFRCSFCLAEFQTVNLKREHLKSMHPETRFLCRVCPGDFHAKDERLRHEIKVHRVNIDKPDQLFICEVCDKPFSTMRFFTQHVATHSNNK